MPLTSDEEIAALLNETKTIAVQIASLKSHRDSNKICKFLIKEGYEVYPINAGHKGALLHGREIYASLHDLPGPVDMVDIFRKSDRAGSIVDEAIKIGAKSVWMQLGVIDEAAARRAEDAGLKVVMDRCPAKDIPQLQKLKLMS